MDISENPVARLTPRELEILNLLRAGKTQGEIAALLGRTRHAVKNHMASIFIKLDSRTTAQAVGKFCEAGLK